MPNRDEDLTRIVREAAADGLSEAQVDALVSKYDELNPTSPAPRSDAEEARWEGDNRWDVFGKKMLSNAPRDAKRIGLGVVDMMNAVPRAVGELGRNTAERLIEVTGGTPQYTKGTPNIDTLSNYPKQLIDRLGRYADSNERALLVREEPLGMVADLLGARALTPTKVRTFLEQGRTVPPMPKASDVASTAAHGAAGYALGGPMGAVKGILGKATHNKIIDTLLRREPAKTPVAGARVVHGTPTPSVEDALMQAMNELRGTSSVELPLSHPTGGGSTVPSIGIPIKGARVVAPQIQQSLESSLNDVMREGMRQTDTSIPFSHPTGGESTIPHGNAPFALSSNPKNPTLNTALQDALESAMRERTPDSVSLPDQSSGPSVTMSPDARAAMKRVDNAVKAGKPNPESAAATSAPKAPAQDLRLLELSRKRVLTPAETQELAWRVERARTSAQEQGMNYAGYGAARNQPGVIGR